jgi:hypothetical protein
MLTVRKLTAALLAMACIEIGGRLVYLLHTMRSCRDGDRLPSMTFTTRVQHANPNKAGDLVGFGDRELQDS